MYSTGVTDVGNTVCSKTYTNNLETLRLANLTRFNMDKAKDQQDLNKRKPTLLMIRV